MPASALPGTHSIPFTRTETQERCSCKMAKRLLVAAGETPFVCMKDRSDRRHICKVDLPQVDETIFRTDLTPVLGSGKVVFSFVSVFDLHGKE